MKKQFCALLLSCLSVTLPAAAQRTFPLERLTLPEGQQPNVRATRTGFVVKNRSPLAAVVVCPPDAFLCRLRSDDDPDVVQLAIGRVNSLLCNALFSPQQDQAIEFSGARVALRWQGGRYRLTAQGPLTVTILRDFMKTERGLKWFKPLDKSVFRRAPAGWCSWYAYHQGITEAEMVKNIDWLAQHLKQFGCEYIQLDDGWQGIGHGYGDNRDWYVTDRTKFPHGMKWLADAIRANGFKPGIWLIPFAESNPALFRRHPDLFLKRPDGASVGEQIDPKTGKPVPGKVSWTGRYLVDPTSPAAGRWFHDLFRMICRRWGYEYVKIDGQGGSRGACASWRQQLADPSLPPDEAYRRGLAAISKTMGPRRFLLNCAGQYDSCGYCQGVRIGSDVGPSWTRMQPALRATRQHLFLNSICFWTDPDVVCVRPRGDAGSSLTLEQARVWATFVGLTGQLLMSSDRMYALPEERVELLRRIYPVADIRPLDLYPLPGMPHVFDVRIAKPGVGNWDVVGLFNWDPAAATQLSLTAADLGLPRARYVFYDVWQKRLLAVTSKPLLVSLLPTSCRVLAVRRFRDHPQLVGDSRHLTQGADDLIAARWDPRTCTWRGRSRVTGGDPYELRFTLPPGWSAADHRLEPVGPLAVLTLRRDRNSVVSWRARFRRSPVSAASPVVYGAAVTPGSGGARLTWKGAHAFAWRVYRNGKLLAQVTRAGWTDLPPGRNRVYRYAVSAVGWLGESRRAPAGEFVRKPSPRGVAEDVYLEDLSPLFAQQDYGRLQRRTSVQGNPLRIAGKQFSHGLGAHANAQLVYQLHNRYRRFEAFVGVDDEKGGSGTVRFQVFTNDEKVFDSGVMVGHQPAKRVSVSLAGVDDLRLVVTDAGDGIDCDHADWADARLLGNHSANP